VSDACVDRQMFDAAVLRCLAHTVLVCTQSWSTARPQSQIHVNSLDMSVFHEDFSIRTVCWSGHRLGGF